MMFYLPKDVFVDWWIINTSFCIFLLVSFLTLVDSFARQLAAGFYMKQVKENPGYKKANIISINAKYGLLSRFHDSILLNTDVVLAFLLNLTFMIREFPRNFGRHSCQYNHFKVSSRNLAFGIEKKISNW